MRNFINIIAESTTPRVLYHGTKPEFAEKIAREGLTVESDTSWREMGPGVYLAGTIETAKSYGEVVFAVDTSKLNLGEWFGPMGADDYEMQDYIDGEWGDGDDKEDFSHGASWLDSLRICDQCKYMDDIPPSALTRID